MESAPPLEGRCFGVLPMSARGAAALRRAAEDHGPGAFWWSVGLWGGRILYALLPTGGGRWVRASCPIWPRNAAGPHWRWNGDEQRPTLTPSIHVTGPRGTLWHGRLEDGRFTATCTVE